MANHDAAMTGEKHRKILFVAPSWVGDMIMAQSLLKLLKRNDQTAIIDALAPPWTLPLARFMPEIRRAIESPFRHGELNLRRRRSLGRALRAEGYDIAYILPRTLKAALVPYWANIPVRVGHPRGAGYGLVTDRRVADPGIASHQSARFAALATPIPDLDDIPQPALAVTPDQTGAALADLDMTPPTGSVLVLAPGSGNTPSKRWPVRHFVEVARRYGERGWRIWLIGSPDDRTVCAAIHEAAGTACEVLAGRASLEQTVALIARADAVLTNDSGALHIAAALGRRTVAVFGPTDPGFTLPRGAAIEALRTGIACSPCFADICPLGHHRCMEDLAPATVLAALDR